MLSALIPSEHSYPALQLVPKLVDQRFAQPGPLVLGSTSLKRFTPAVDKDQPVSRIFSRIPTWIGLYIYPLNLFGDI